MPLNKIIVLGSGNVATHLSLALNNAGFNLLQVYSRNISNAQELADKVLAKGIDSVDDILPDADFYLVCLSDSVIAEVLSQLRFIPSLIAHTAGSIPMEILQQFPRHGVFYPLQSFTKGSTLDIRAIPFCIEANSEEAKLELFELGNCLSDKVKELNSKQRKQCHVAGVLVNNFVNHLYGLGAEVLKDSNLSFDLLKPLILETAKKVQEMSPVEAQTGPAIRGNTEVINNHLEMMKAYDLDGLYQVLSADIMKKNKE